MRVLDHMEWRIHGMRGVPPGWAQVDGSFGCRSRLTVGDICRRLGLLQALKQDGSQSCHGGAMEAQIGIVRSAIPQGEHHPPLRASCLGLRRESCLVLEQLRNGILLPQVLTLPLLVEVQRLFEHLKHLRRSSSMYPSLGLLLHKPSLWWTRHLSRSWRTCNLLLQPLISTFGIINVKAIIQKLFLSGTRHIVEEQQHMR